MPSTLESARAEALFVSTVQPSELPTADEVRHAVAATLRRWRICGCVAQVAAEFDCAQLVTAETSVTTSCR